MTRPARVPGRSRVARLEAVLTVAGIAGVAVWAAARRPARPRPGSPRGARITAAPRRAARRARQGSILLAASAALDSAAEHYRGDFHHAAMYVGPLAAAGALAASAAGPRMPGPAREALLASAVAVGIAGHLFHVRNILERPGGFGWSNLFYAAPIGAPGSVALAGLAGLTASALDGGSDPGRTGRAMAVGAIAGLVGTAAEVALLHFRGAFHNPAMYIPVSLPPVAALAVAEAVRSPTPARLKAARRLLSATAAMGLIGTGFHAWGVQRNMGGWRNWSQNLQVAPPLPAPPGFTGVALAGLGAIDLLEASA